MKRLLPFVAALLCGAAASAQSVDSSALIMRSVPYLQNPTDGGITVCWQTALPCYSVVEWTADTTQTPRTARTLIAGQALAGNTTNKIRITGIEPGKTYYYRIVSRHLPVYQAYKKVFGGSYTSPYYAFRLPAPSASDFDALVFNDLHQRPANLEKLMEVVRAKGIDYNLVLMNGDCVDDPKDEAQCIATTSAYNRLLGSTSVPVLYMRGNHEIRNAYSVGLTELFDYVGGKTYGAFSWGDTRFVLLDCGEDKPDDHWVYYGLNDFTGLRADQLEFLKKEHKSKEFRGASKRVLVHHIPLWGLDPKEDGTYNPSGELWGAELAGQPYAFAINGHTHRARLHERGTVGNPFAVGIGGGSSLPSATVIHLQKRGKSLTATCYGPDGQTVWGVTDSF